MITVDDIPTKGGVPVAVELHEGPTHPEIPLTAYALITTLDEEEIARARKMLEAVATLAGQEIPDELKEILAPEGADREVEMHAPVGDVFTLCWN